MRRIRRHVDPDPADITRTVVEVAAVKARAMTLVRRIQDALTELGGELGQLQGGEGTDDVPGPGETDRAGPDG